MPSVTSVELTVRGIDEASDIFESIEDSATNSMDDIEKAIESIPNVQIESDLRELLELEEEIEGLEGSVNSLPELSLDTDYNEVIDARQELERVNGSIRGVPDVNIDADLGPLQRMERSINGVDGAIRAIPDPNIDGSQPINELDDIEREANQTREAIEGINMEQVLGGLVAGGGIAGVVQNALGRDTLETQIDVLFNVDEQGREIVVDTYQKLVAYGIDGPEALQAMRRQWNLNADASDEVNQNVTQLIGSMVNFSGGQLDLNEVTQEVNEIASAIGITDTQAVGLTNSLLNMGFPPEQIDIISEYSTQLADVGYSAEQIQAIFEAGVETGTWNIDNLLDGIKEGNILISEFGQGVDDTTNDLIAQTGLSIDQFNEWSRAINEGGEQGAESMTEVAKWLQSIEDETVKSALGVQLFGTMYEDQGDKIVETLINAENKQVDLNENIAESVRQMQELDASPAVLLSLAFSEVQEALEPVNNLIDDVVGNIAVWIAENPNLVATLTILGATLGIVYGGVVALLPVLLTMASYMTIARTATSSLNLALLKSPFVWVTGLVIALAGAMYYLYKNWDDVSTFLSESFDRLGVLIPQIIDRIATELPRIVEQGTQIASNLLDAIVTNLPKLIESGSQMYESLIQGIIDNLPMIVEVITMFYQRFIDFIVQYLPMIVQAGVNILVSLIEGIISYLEPIIGAVILIVNTLVDVVTEYLPIIIQAGIDILLALIDGIITILPTLIEAGISLVMNLVQVFIDNLPMLIDAGIEILMALIDGIVAVVPELIASAVTLLIALSETLSDNIDKIIEAGIEILLALIDGLIEAIPLLLDAIPTIVEAIFDAFAKVEWVEIGKSIIDGLIEGIKSMTGAVGKAIGSVASGVLNTAKNIFEIGSPSQLFADEIGQWIPIGMASGIRSELDEVNSALREVALPNYDVLEPSLQPRMGTVANVGDYSNGRSYDNDINDDRPLEINLKLGTNDFKAYVDDITRVQEREQKRLKMYRGGGSK